MAGIYSELIPTLSRVEVGSRAHVVPFFFVVRCHTIVPLFRLWSPPYWLLLCYVLFVGGRGIEPRQAPNTPQMVGDHSRMKAFPHFVCASSAAPATAANTTKIVASIPLYHVSASGVAFGVVT